MKKKKFEVKELNIADLKTAEYNPRKISKEQLEKLVASLKEDPDFLWHKPIIVNSYKGRENVVIAGNQRFLAAKSLGWKTIPGTIANVPPSKEKRWNIKDNINMGEWDSEKFAEVYTELIKDIDISNIGMKESEINKLLKSVQSESDIKGEVEFTEELLEENNYIVLVFKNKLDWLQAQTVLGIKSVKALDSKKEWKRVGLGRVIDGVKVINKIK